MTVHTFEMRIGEINLIEYAGFVVGVRNLSNQSLCQCHALSALSQFACACKWFVFLPIFQHKKKTKNEKRNESFAISKQKKKKATTKTSEAKMQNDDLQNEHKRKRKISEMWSI